LKRTLYIIFESLRLAYQELLANKLRTFLSLLGITIGIFCIIILLTAVTSMKLQLSNSLNKLGSNFVMIEKWPWAFNDSNYAWWKYWNRPNPNLAELKAIKNQVPSCKNAALITNNGNVEIVYQKNLLENIGASSVSSEFGQMMDLNFEDGRFFSESESNSGAATAIIGYEVACKLNKGNPDMVGRQITVLKNQVTIIGVLKKEGQSMFNNSFDNNIILNYNYFKLMQDEKSGDLNVQIKIDPIPLVSSAQLKDEIRQVMRSMRKLHPKQEDNFAMNEMSMLQDGFNSIFQVMNLVGIVIGFLSLVVGGFGIANIMFVSVKERTSQIGIKMALGANANHILLEFLIESIGLCILGGIIGIMLVFVVTIFVTKFLDFKLVLTINNVIIGILISAFIGLVAGILPAHSASKLNPVDAIRS
jgi:putative ABC transport system permease protein